MGKLGYLISVWGGTSKKNLDSLQVIQNRAAKLVTRRWQSSTIDNLRAIDWLSVNQLAFYHTVLLMYKIKSSRYNEDISVPQYLLNMFEWSYQYNTRQVQGGKIKPKGIPRLDITKSSFRYRAADQFNQLPEDVINSKTIDCFKDKVKLWIKENVQLRA